MAKQTQRAAKLCLHKVLYAHTNDIGLHASLSCNALDVHDAIDVWQQLRTQKIIREREKKQWSSHFQNTTFCINTTFLL